MTEIEQARQVLEAERQAVLAGLADERAAAERAAEEQRRWRAEVEALLERGRAVDLSIADMADALGVSRQWTNHLAKRAIDKELVKRVAKMPPPQILGTMEFGQQHRQPPPET
jgi:hypothetical protein